MTNIKIRYDGKYYEYDNKELNANVYYESTDEQLLSLFSTRTKYIKDLNMGVEVLKYKKDANVEFYKTLCDRAIKKIYELEEEIASVQKALGCTLDWYSPTNPRNAEDVPELEEQKKFICSHCGYELDEGYVYNNEDYGISPEEFCKNKCPNCKQEESFYSRNKYLIQAQRYQDDANHLFQNERILEGAKTLEKAISELEQVNHNDEDDYLTALYERAVAKQSIARTYVSMENFDMGLQYIDEAIQLWNTAMDNHAVYDLNRVAMAYYVRQCCCLALNKNLDSVLEDGSKALQLLNTYKNYTDASRDDKDAQTYVKCYNEYEGISMIEYITIYDALHMLNKPEAEIDSAYNRAKQFLDQCTHLDSDERNDFYRSLNKYSTSKETSTTPAKKEGCYIATAVYGDYNAEPVLVLRKFRDNVLKNSVIGRAFIRVYYRYSPALAEKLKGKSGINRRIKNILDIFVCHLSEKEKTSQ